MKRQKFLISRILWRLPSTPYTYVGLCAPKLSSVENCYGHVFYIKAVSIDLTSPSGKRQHLICGEQGDIPSWTGTGFLLSDGRFVTARHVIEAWAFPMDGKELDKDMATLNIVANNGGKVIAQFSAISSSGVKFLFTSDQFVVNRQNDIVTRVKDNMRLVQARAGDTDYAYYRTGRTPGLPFNAKRSKVLPIDTKLKVLGFPYGLGVNSSTDIEPIYGSAIVAKKGLQNGVILTTDSNYEQGNSGGPVFCENEKGELEVVGLVSAGAGRNMGFIVPIAALI